MGRAVVWWQSVPPPSLPMLLIADEGCASHVVPPG
jgi:hypothetical protein